MNNILEATRQLIAIPSTTDNPTELHRALDSVADQLASVKNVTIERFESNGKPSLLAYKGSSRPHSFRILLNGHVDVVPAKAAQFTSRVKEGRLYGRGALDMKTAALVLTQVFCEMVDKVPYTLGLQIVTDEEVGGNDGTAYQLAQGVNAALAIAGEFTPLGAICNESRGLCWAELEFQGVAAHSAYPWNGTNAILLAQQFTQKLLAAIPTPTTDEWCTTANIAMIETQNTTFNRVPDTARLGIDIRFIANDHRFASRQSAVDFLQSLAPKNTRIDIKKLEPSHFADPKNSDLQALAKAVAKISGHSSRFIRKHGASDIRFFSQYGIPGVVIGVQGAGLHGDEEYVEIDSIERYQTTLATFLQDLRD